MRHEARMIGAAMLWMLLCWLAPGAGSQALGSPARPAGTAGVTGRECSSNIDRLRVTLKLEGVLLSIKKPDQSKGDFTLTDQVDYSGGATSDGSPLNTKNNITYTGNLEFVFEMSGSDKKHPDQLVRVPMAAQAPGAGMDTLLFLGMDKGTSQQEFKISGADLAAALVNIRRNLTTDLTKPTKLLPPVNQRITGHTKVTADCTVIGETAPCATAAPVETTLSVEPNDSGDGSETKTIPAQ